VAFEVARGGFLDKHTRHIINVYRERRDVMLDSLEEHMPAGVKWTHPEGGLFLWLTLPEHMDTVEMFPDAIAQKVAYVPGISFYPNGGGRNTLRMNFSYSTPELINEGVSRLSTVFRKWMNN
jgi:2-aminoadipate transaminase